MKWTRLLLAVTVLTALCALTACTPVDLDALARLQAQAIIQSIPETGMNELIGDREEELCPYTRQIGGTKGCP